MKELTVTERAKKALSIQHTESELSSLSSKYSDIKAIENRDDYSLVKGACREFQSVRVAITKAGKAARDDANAFSKAVISEEKRLLNIFVPEENRIKDIRKEYDDREIRIASEKLKKEEDRKESIQNNIAIIRSYAEDLFGMNSTELKRILDSAVSSDINESDFQEFTDEATIAKNAVITKLEAAYKERKEFEVQKEASDKIAAEQAAERAELDKKAEELRKQEEKIQAEKRAEDEKKLAAERAEAAKVRQEKERLEKEARDKAEAEQLAAENEAERVRQESMRPEKEKLIDWLKKLRFIDGIELHDKKLSNIQKSTLAGLSKLSIEGVQLVNNA